MVEKKSVFDFYTQYLFVRPLTSHYVNISIIFIVLFLSHVNNNNKINNKNKETNITNRFHSKDQEVSLPLKKKYSSERRIDQTVMCRLKPLAV